jgi:uncharacterized membrane protein
MPESDDIKQRRRKKPPLSQVIAAPIKPVKMGIIARLRGYFFTGLVVAAPVSITIYLVWTFVTFIDGWIKPLVPDVYNPENYLPFSIPGVGVLFAFVLLTLLGALTANLFGRTIVAYGEQMFNRMPVVRSVYKALKQIFETALSQSSSSFQDVGLIEYPRKGLWAIVFISTKTSGEIPGKAGHEEMLSVFLPTTPNPTSGYLLFVPREDILLLDMTVEDGAKLVISAGLVTPKDTSGQSVIPTVDPAALKKRSRPAASARKPRAARPRRGERTGEEVD